jgi:hypothetical protein
MGALSATLIVIALRVSGAMSFCRSSRSLFVGRRDDLADGELRRLFVATRATPPTVPFRKVPAKIQPVAGRWCAGARSPAKLALCLRCWNAGTGADKGRLPTENAALQGRLALLGRGAVHSINNRHWSGFIDN